MAASAFPWQENNTPCPHESILKTLGEDEHGVYTFKPSTWESSLCEFGLAWSKYQVPGQLELDVRLSLKNKQTKKTLQN